MSAELQEFRQTSGQLSLPPGTSQMVAQAATVSKLEGSSMYAPLEFRSIADDECSISDAIFDGEKRSFGEHAAFDPSPRADRRGNGKTREAVQWAADTQESVEAARRAGFQEGEREGRHAAQTQLEPQMLAAVAQERKRVLDAVEEFASARNHYFAEVEQEVVKLALAIAARVLHREATMDPLLLTAAVRVALDKMSDRSGVVLRSPQSDVAGWEQMFHKIELVERPRVITDEHLTPGECVLETKLGTVELGVRAQLEEIEKGFFDLLNHRPQL